MISPGHPHPDNNPEIHFLGLLLDTMLVKLISRGLRRTRHMFPLLVNFGGTMIDYWIRTLGA
jgi:hypothetical protein